MTRVTLEHDWFSRPVPENVSIGSDSWLYSSFSFLHYESRRPAGVRVGSNSGVYMGTFFDLGPEGEVEIGDFCTLVGPIISTNGRVVIGDYSFIAHEVVISDEQVAVPFGSRRSADDSPPPSAHPVVSIGENVWIGTRAIVLAGADIGDGAVVGAASVVDGPVAPFAIVAGDPARQVGDARSTRS